MWGCHRPAVTSDDSYPNLAVCSLSLSFVIFPAWGSPYTPFWISIYTNYLCAKFLSLYLWKSKRGCMGYPKQKKLQMINLSYIYPVWILAGTHHSRPVDASNFPPSISTGSGWLWSQIWAPRGYHTSSWYNFYEISEYWGGKLYCGLNLKWDY